MRADRYLRQGTSIPKIYHGDSRSLREAMSEAAAWSKVFPGPHTLSVVRDGQLTVLQVYENGKCTWIQEREEM